MDNGPLVSIVWALVIVTWVALVAIWVGALIDAGRMPNTCFTRAGSNKGMTMLLLIVAGSFGAVYWFVVLRRPTSAA